MEINRQDPNQLPGVARNETQTVRRGKLKIFFGYAAGVGKTYTMLQAAHQAQRRGIDVAAGYINPGAWPQTAALLDGLEQLPTKQLPGGKTELREFDLDAALARKPQLILIDDLAHVNGAGSRHSRRYQDVQELRSAGIDVYATVNVQHIESLNDTVAAITGVMVQDRIPDSVFDRADQVELVDTEPEELLERLADRAASPASEDGQPPVAFFTAEQLTALREIALRRCADRVSLLTEHVRIQNQSEYHTGEHILVCLSPSPSNAKIIRTAARMAQAFRGTFTALFVQTSDTEAMDPNDRQRLRENMRLAQQLGATIETSHGEDVAYQIAEYARLSDVSKIVIGHSNAVPRGFFGKPSLTNRLIAAAPNMDIYVIPDANSGLRTQRQRSAKALRIPFRDIWKCILVLLAATLLGYGFYGLHFTEVNIVSVYIFAVLVISVITTNSLCGLLASAVSVLIFNFFFTVPRFTFQFNDPDYLVTFTIMFMVALLTGSLAARLKDSARQSARAAFRTQVLFETNQLLQKETDEQAVINATAGQLTKLLKRDVVIYLSHGEGLLEPSIYRAESSSHSLLDSEREKAVAAWVLKNNEHAGATTDTLFDAKCLYLAIRINQQVYGVVGIAMDGVPLDAFENSVLLSILGECALALENIKNAREKEDAAILAKNEQLRANLLRAISHDLRTPLTSISGSADNLLVNYQKMDASTRMQTFTDIYDDSQWLINLVENLLAITRIGAGQVNLNRSVELMDEVVTEALRHINRKRTEHTIRVSSTDDLILAQMDAKLIVQVIINLVDNAIKYTPAGSVIEIRTEKEGEWVMVSVSDDGPGIPDEQKPRIFDMFYSGTNKIADSRRSMGLGLALCKSIVAAHGGVISVSDHQPRGSVFTFTLPAGEVALHE